jgi:hypothetical protein
VLGIVNVGLMAVVLDSVAATPPVCFHRKLEAPVEPEPSRVTSVPPARTDCGGPAFARGGAIAATVTTSSVVFGPPGL